MRILIPFWKAAVWLAIIASLSLMPPDDLPKTQLALIPHFDKIVHAILYLVLAILLVRPVRLLGWKSLPVIMAVTLLLGGGIELLQWAVTNSRSASWLDLLADLAGGLSGWIIYKSFLSRTILSRFL